MPANPVLWDLDARGVATVTLNRPEVNNAYDAVQETGRRGQIKIRTRRQGEMIEVAIADNGTGIPENDLPKIFLPFFTTKSEGTGLGLALVKSLASMHGGEATLESALGEGTIVRLRLPHAAVSADGARLEPGAKVLPFRAA